MEKDTRVALVREPRLVGKIVSVDRRNATKTIAEIVFEGGGTGRFPLSDLVEVDPNTPENKTWPPAGLETKAMT